MQGKMNATGMGRTLKGEPPDLSCCQCGSPAKAWADRHGERFHFCSKECMDAPMMSDYWLRGGEVPEDVTR